MSLYEKLSLLSEAIIIAILLMEFVYDFWYNGRNERFKRRQRRKKALDFMELNEGEGK